ncbi:MAG: hypothetical protein H7306_20855 [Bacteriovorax sp.]|nr:hypothetical protein [Rhizobacter sp.]
MVRHETPATTDTASTASIEQWPTFQQRMRRVVEHVYTHLDEPLDRLTLADIAHLPLRPQ